MAKEVHKVIEKKKLTQDEAGILLLLSAFIFGAIFRILPAWMAGFPINDGGMFYTMIEDLRANGYVIPAFTTYNGGNIPFAYPPLGFYLGAGLTDILNLPTPLKIIQFLPSILNSLCIPVFYLFTLEILKDKRTAQIATLIFTLIPHLTNWWSMGGGLTRSLGIIFMLLALTYIHKVLTGSNRRDVLAAIIFSSLTILSHPEAPTYIVSVSILMWLLLSREVKKILYGLVIVIGVLLMISPWVFWVIHYHGTGPFLSASQVAGTFPLLGIFRIIDIQTITQEPLFTLFGSVGFLGFLYLVTKKEWLIPGVFVVMALANPRTSHNAMTIPLAIAGAHFTIEVIRPIISSNLKQHFHGRSILIPAILVPIILLNLILTINEIAGIHVQQNQLSTMEWVKENTLPNSKFIVVTGLENGFCDPINEWFPTLTEKQSVTTPQGSEWLLGKNFQTISAATQELQTCDLNCIQQQTEDYKIDFDYIYLTQDAPNSNCYLEITPKDNRALFLELDNSQNFELVFKSGTDGIYHKK